MRPCRPPLSPERPALPRYLLRRLLNALLLVLGLLTLVFFLVHLMPGDPAELAGEQQLTGAGRELLRQRLGLEGPLWRQYLSWLGGALRGDFGLSLRQQRPVADILAEAIPNTLVLTVTALVVELGAGLLVGLLVARSPGRRRARLLNTGGLVLYSLPSFWLALVAIMIFARNLGWLPAGGMHAPAAWMTPGARFVDLLRHLVLPVLVLGLGNFAVSARYVRATLARILASEWILALRARGLGEAAVIRHALRGALPPVLTLVGLSLPGLLGGAVAVEEVFAWPGLGRVSVQALLARDYPVIMAVTAIVAVLVTVGSLLADLACRGVDPRLRLEAEAEEVR
jgi:peptide/nickel transport system permease protein